MWGGLVLLALGPCTLMSLACATPLEGTFQFESFADRSAVVAMPVAPPPPAARRIVDVEVREIVSTVTSGGDVRSTQTAVYSARTDGAITARLTNFLAIRALGGLGYGPITGRSMPSVPWSTMPSGTLGLGIVVGYWGDRDWSLHVELDALGVLFANADRYEVRVGSCSTAPRIFGGGENIFCGGAPTGALTQYQGYSFGPTAGGSIDFAGVATDWLRIGGGLSAQALLGRALDGGQVVQPVGIARLFVELRWEDVTLAVEVQQAITEGFALGPMIGITVGGAAFDHANRRPARGLERNRVQQPVTPPVRIEEEELDAGESALDAEAEADVAEGVP